MSSSAPEASPSSSIPILTTVTSFREWRQEAFDDRQTVGFVATMGALHQGHLSLVRRSLAENDLTVLSIFVNPAQFAPHEDLATYPRTLPRDLELLAAESLAVTDHRAPESSIPRTPSAVFLPSVSEMYPSGISQDKASQKGTFVEVKGYGNEMEGKSRPDFFRGVATVVIKLFNVIQPTNTYFGQKDIQQALLLRRLCKDLLLSHPDPAHLHIVPTARDASDGLALSSRNAYLSLEGRKVAGTLRAALLAAEDAWNRGGTKEECVHVATTIVERRKMESNPQGNGDSVNLRLDYVEMNDSATFEVLDSFARKEGQVDSVILSGALWVDETRLIDNIILGDATTILV